MDSTTSPWLDAILRWTHVLAGILWIGHQYFSTFVEAQAKKACGADSTSKLASEMMARALYWLRWGAACTWVTGIVLTGLVYYSVTDNLVRREVRFAFKYGLTTDFTLATNDPVVSQRAGVMISLAIIVVVFLAYEAVWKVLGRYERSAAAVSLAAFALTLFLLSRVFTGRAVFLHAGALLGSIMAMNVWMRIWPAQKKAIQAMHGPARAPDTSAQGMAASRSKHNAYMSVPVVFAMVSNMCDRDDGWAMMTALVLVGFALAWALYGIETRRGAAPSPRGMGRTRPALGRP